MSFKFRKRIKIMPGVHLNIGKTGVSTSIGVRGAGVTTGKNTRVHVGIPGTGLSHTTVLAPTPTPRTEPIPPNRTSQSFGPVATFLIVWTTLSLLGALPMLMLITNENALGSALLAWSVFTLVVAWKTAAAAARRRRRHQPTP